MKTASFQLIALFMCLSLSESGYSSTGGESEWFNIPAPDQTHWSAKRIEKYASLNAYELGEPQAVVRIATLGIAVPVYPDSQIMALEAGAAWVSSTAEFGSAGNVAIAGHRDSFFRPLENIPIGTRIQVSTADGEHIYAVSSVRIVDALDISPLESSDTSLLTLITCHPFIYRGYAPNRYIVQAIPVDTESSANRSGQVDPAAFSGQLTLSKSGVSK